MRKPLPGEIAPNAAIAQQNVRRIPAHLPIFNKDNYRWMLIGLVVIAIGMFLLSGGKNTDPNVFDRSKVYSSMRITIAPLLILAGLVIEIFAVFRKPSARSNTPV